MSRKVVNKGGHGVGTPYDFPAYEYDPVNDSFKDLETGKTFTKDGNAKLEANKAVTVSENGPQIITPSPTYDGMEKVTLDVQVPQGGDIEANKAATIDVSAYTEPVEVTPTEGKDGMAKCTVTLSNIPSPGLDKLYAWYDSDTNVRGFSTTESVAIGDKLLSQDATLYALNEEYWFMVTAVGEGTVTIINSSTDTYVLTRDTEHDISF